MVERRATRTAKPKEFPAGGKGDRRRREILDAAAKVINKVGYANASLEDIAAANKISKSALYHYFRSRDEILFAMHEVLTNDFLDHAAMVRESGGSATEMLRAAISKMVLANESIPGYVQAFFEHYHDLSPAYRRTAHARSVEYTRFVESILEKGIADGEFRPMPVHATTLAIFGMCNWVNKWFRPSGELTGAAIAEIWTDLVLGGLQLGGTTAPAGPSDGAGA
ncbi:TetR/AcrR family transcriptional regulator [Pseudonocardia broussonetiae]|uniref:TetR/AcrR family transcriptional regulator n=1 Tax=Pseudonocardia broussonetiae TaxID=2736640 RepID=A0A6M6JIZ3_9PSEU|nr:TetR/AcrR family transcriptional regulator [Pseudonocardia broussonetiae]QJY48064.1 TetR/AcrR family transcriptional regulator [Pseudonocardia broussonetiae]